MTSDIPIECELSETALVSLFPLVYCKEGLLSLIIQGIGISHFLYCTFVCRTFVLCIGKERVQCSPNGHVCVFR